MGTRERLAGQPCEKCGTKKTKWLEQSPQSHNAYKVVCCGCDKFIKWGKRDEYILLTNKKLTEFVAYAPEPPKATLEGFFSE